MLVMSKLIVTYPEIENFVNKHHKPGTELTYLSGPMSGIPNFNFPTFYEKEEMLNERGISVVNPARADEELGMPADEDARIIFMHRDVAFLYYCDSITQMKGWEKSRGATFEAIVAYEFGLKFRNHRGEEVLSYNPLEYLRCELERIRGDRDDWKAIVEMNRMPFCDL